MVRQDMVAGSGTLLLLRSSGTGGKTHGGRSWNPSLGGGALWEPDLCPHSWAAWREIMALLPWRVWGERCGGELWGESHGRELWRESREVEAMRGGPWAAKCEGNRDGRAMRGTVRGALWGETVKGEPWAANHERNREGSAVRGSREGTATTLCHAATLRALAKVPLQETYLGEVARFLCCPFDQLLISSLLVKAWCEEITLTLCHQGVFSLHLTDKIIAYSAKVPTELIWAPSEMSHHSVPSWVQQPFLLNNYSKHYPIYRKKACNKNEHGSFTLWHEYIPYLRIYSGN